MAKVEGQGPAIIQNNNQGLLRNLDAVQITSIVVSAIALAAIATGAVALSGIGAGFLAALGSYVPLYVTASGASLLGAGTLTTVLKEYAKKRNVEAPAPAAEAEEEVPAEAVSAPAREAEVEEAPAQDAGYVSDSDDEDVVWHDAVEEPQEVEGSEADEEEECHDAVERQDGASEAQAEAQPEAEVLTAEEETQVAHAASTVIQRVFRGNVVRRNPSNV